MGRCATGTVTLKGFLDYLAQDRQGYCLTLAGLQLCQAGCGPQAIATMWSRASVLPLLGIVILPKATDPVE